MKTRTRKTPDVVAIRKDIADAMNRPYMPRKQTILNTTRVQGKPSKGTTNMTVGIYSPMSAELRELDRFANQRNGHWLPKPRLVKPQK